MRVGARSRPEIAAFLQRIDGREKDSRLRIKTQARVAELERRAEEAERLLKENHHRKVNVEKTLGEKEKCIESSSSTAC